MGTGIGQNKHQLLQSIKDSGTILCIWGRLCLYIYTWDVHSEHETEQSESSVVWGMQVFNS